MIMASSSSPSRPTRRCPEIIDAYKEQPIPAIIPIPGKDGSLGIGIRNVKKNVERAVGADILFNED